MSWKPGEWGRFKNPKKLYDAYISCRIDAAQGLYACDMHRALFFFLLRHRQIDIWSPVRLTLVKKVFFLGGDKRNEGALNTNAVG